MVSSVLDAIVVFSNVLYTLLFYHFALYACSVSFFIPHQHLSFNFFIN